MCFVSRQKRTLHFGILGFCPCVNDCVAASGVLRFSVCSSAWGCTLLLCIMEENKMKRKQRHIWILCMVFIFSLLLSACSSTSSSTQENTVSSQAPFGRVSVATDAFPDSSTTPDTQPQDDAPDESAAPVLNTVTLADSRSFSEGIAWVQYYDNARNLQFGWLHPDGSIDQPFLLSA